MANPELRSCKSSQLLLCIFFLCSQAIVVEVSAIALMQVVNCLQLARKGRGHKRDGTYFQEGEIKISIAWAVFTGCTRNYFVNSCFHRRLARRTLVLAAHTTWGGVLHDCLAISGMEVGFPWHPDVACSLSFFVKSYAAYFGEKFAEPVLPACLLQTTSVDFLCSFVLSPCWRRRNAACWRCSLKLLTLWTPFTWHRVWPLHGITSDWHWEIVCFGLDFGTEVFREEHQDAV